MFNALICDDVGRIAPYITIAISTPFDRYKQLLQIRKTIIEIQNDTNNNKNLDFSNAEILQNPKLSNINSLTSIKYDCLSRSIMVLITRITNFTFQKMIKPKLLRQPIDSDFIGDMKSISSESIAKIYGLSSYYFIETCRTYSIFGNSLPNRYSLYNGFGIQCLRILLQTIISNKISDKLSAKYEDGSNGFVSLGIGFISFSIGQIITYPLDTISKRQMITNEPIIEATNTLVKKHGYSALFDGCLWEVISDFVTYTTYMTIWINCPTSFH